MESVVTRQNAQSACCRTPRKPKAQSHRGTAVTRVAQMVEHGACNARAVGLIPTGDPYEKSMKMYALTIVNCSLLKCKCNPDKCARCLTPGPSHKNTMSHTGSSYIHVIKPHKGLWGTQSRCSTDITNLHAPEQFPRSRHFPSGVSLCCHIPGRYIPKRNMLLRKHPTLSWIS